jgi:hypothetical protein
MYVHINIHILLPRPTFFPLLEGSLLEGKNLRLCMLHILISISLYRLNNEFCQVCDPKEAYMHIYMCTHIYVYIYVHTYTYT